MSKKTAPKKVKPTKKTTQKLPSTKTPSQKSASKPASSPKKSKPTKKTSSSAQKKTITNSTPTPSKSTSKPAPKSTSKKASSPFATFMIWFGVIVILAGIIYFIIPENKDSQTLDTEKTTYNSSGLSDEELVASIPTQFNQRTGTVNENLGTPADSSTPTSTLDSDLTEDTNSSPTPTPNPLAETGLQELNNLQTTAITSTQEQITQVGEQVDYTTASVIDRIGQIISGFISWGRNWLFGQADQLGLPSPEPVPTPTPEPTPTPTVEVLEINTVPAVPAQPLTPLIQPIVTE